MATLLERLRKVLVLLKQSNIPGGDVIR